MTTIMERKHIFAMLPAIQALKTVQCGFELETQAVNGLTYSEMQEEHEPEFNQDAFDEACDGYVDRALNYNLSESVLKNLFIDGLMATIRSAWRVRPDSRFAQNLKELLLIWQQDARCTSSIRELDFTALVLYSGADTQVSIASLTNDMHKNTLKSVIDTSPKVSDLYNALVDELRVTISNQMDRSEYYSDPDDSILNINLPQGIIAKPDGSVEGPEFVVAGNGTSAANFSKLLRLLYKRFEFTIDTGCSFHIHVSVPGITHAYGPMLQAHMIEYLLNNVHRVPHSVQTRWKADTDYFKPRIDNDKYTFVNYHARCKTWEFRCFGNVQNARDGMRCLRLAVAALQYAYKVNLGLTESILQVKADWQEKIYRAVIRSTDKKRETVSSVIKKERSAQRQSERSAA